MFKSVLFCFYGILSVTATHHGHALPTPTKNKINDLAQELALEDNNKDNRGDIELSDNVGTRIDNDNIFRRNNNRSHTKKFTDFIQLVIDVLIKFEDADLEHFFTILDDETDKYHYNGCKFHELSDNYGFKKLLARKFNNDKNITADNIRQNIQNIADKIRKSEYDDTEKNLIDYINTLYRQDSLDKLDKFLVKIDNYRFKNKEQLDLVKIVREGLRSIIFNHYSKLDYNTRAVLKSKVDRYWEHAMPIPRAYRSQLNAREIQLLENQNKDDTIFQFTAKYIHETKSTKHVKGKKSNTTFNTFIPYTFKTLYPKLVEWVMMHSRSSKPLKSQISTSPRTKNTWTIGPESEEEAEDSEINHSYKAKTKHVTEIMFRQLNNADSKHDANDYLAIESEIRNKDLELNTAPVTSIPTTHGTSTIKDKTQMFNKIFVPNTTAHIMVKDTRKILTTRNMLRTVQKHKQFIEVATLRPFMAKKTTDSKKMIYEINLNKLKPQTKFQVRSRTLTSVPGKYISNADSSSTHEGLSIEIKEDGDTQAYKNHYKNHLYADAVVIDEDVFTRLQELENELNDVKIIVNNDTKMIQNIKHNIELNVDKSEKASKELILDKVIHSNDTDDNKKQVQRDERQLMRNYHGPRKVLLKKNRSSKHFSTEEGERDNLPYISKLVYNKNNNTANYFNSRADKSSKSQEIHSRSAMIDKVKEIKKKLDTANRLISEKNRRNSYLSAETNSAFIPDKDIFDKNMKILEKYLNLSKMTINK